MPYNETKSCVICDEWVHSKRWALGYRTCRDCGDKQAAQKRKGWTIAPMHKQGYTLITNPKDLKGLNPKRNEME